MLGPQVSPSFSSLRMCYCGSALCCRIQTLPGSVDVGNCWSTVEAHVGKGEGQWVMTSRSTWSDMKKE